MKNKFLLVVLSSLFLLGCPPADESVPNDGLTREEGLYIEADLIQDFYLTSREAFVNVVDKPAFTSNGILADSSVDGAVVKINGTILTKGYRNYSKVIDGIVGGDSISLSVVYNNFNISETLILPNKPVLDTSNATYSEDASYTISWTGVGADADGIEIFVEGLGTVSGDNYRVILSSNKTSHTIPVGIISAPIGFSRIVQVSTYKEKMLTGEGINPKSYYSICNYSNFAISNP